MVDEHGIQKTYATVLSYGCWITLAFLLVAYALYVTGVVPARVPLERIHEYWTMSATTYVCEAGIPTGWGWTRMLRYGEFLSFIGIAALAGLTVLCFLATLPARLKAGDTWYVVIYILEIAVLVLAASGIFASGCH